MFGLRGGSNALHAEEIIAAVIAGSDNHAPLAVGKEKCGRFDQDGGREGGRVRTQHADGGGAAIEQRLDRMQEEAKDLYDWLERGAYFEELVAEAQHLVDLHAAAVADVTRPERGLQRCADVHHVDALARVALGVRVRDVLARRLDRTLVGEDPAEGLLEAEEGGDLHPDPGEAAVL